MPNHVHVIVVPERPNSMARGFGRAHNAYSRYFNTVRRRSGHLWQNRFFSAPLGREHLARALRYVDLNPVRAGLVEDATEYPWSSAQAHTLGRDRWGLLDLDLWQEVCPLGDWEGVLHEGWAADSGWMDELRAATRTGKPLANQDLVKQLEEEVGNDLRVRRRGRPRQTTDSEPQARSATV